MTLDEAIIRAEETAFRMSEGAMSALTKEEADGCLKCSNEHKQLAEWLKELKRYRASEVKKAEREAYEEARREAMRLDDNEDTLKWKGTH